MAVPMLSRYWKRLMPSDLVAEFPGVIASLQCVDITEAARWFLCESGKEEWDLCIDFPSVITPWPFVWLEFRSKGFVIDTTGLAMGEWSSAFGCKITTQEITNGKKALELDIALSMILQTISIAQPTLRVFCETELMKSVAIRGPHLQAAIREGRLPRWFSVIDLYMESFGSLVWLGFLVVYLDERGMILPELIMQLSQHEALTSVQDNHGNKGILGANFFPFAFAISLMHCKNVHFVDVPAVPRPLQKKHESKGIRFFRFKTLEIEPLKAQVRRDGPTVERKDGEIRRALHIVRGHFKDYRESGGLFGKLKGVYWWDMHAAGAIKNGAIIKDYRIIQPAIVELNL